MADGDNKVVSEQVAPEDKEGVDLEMDDDDEDEDFEFNPLLLCSPSPEASSSLSSEDDEDDDGDDNEGEEERYDGQGQEGVGNEEGKSSSDLEEGVNDDDDDDEEFTEEADLSNEEASGHGTRQQEEPAALDASEARHHRMSGEIDDNACNESGLEDCTAKSNEKNEEELLGQTMNSLPDLKSPRKTVIGRQSCQTNDEDDVEDAIFKRTRARYSLADLTLDELETFLQESDEEDYFQNVDDEEEYRKFLAAVTSSFNGNDAAEAVQGTNNDDDDDDDEDTDADFELEIEELLESDDDTASTKSRKRKSWETTDGPETREKSRRRTSGQFHDKPVGLANQRLCHLLPSSEKPPLNALHIKTRVKSGAQNDQDLKNGFTAHQIGQLHCLINEHVQMLIQLIALSVLEPSRQGLVENAKIMLLEIVNKRDEVLLSRKTPYPDICFRPPHTHPSVLDNTCFQQTPVVSDTFAAKLSASNVQNMSHIKFSSSTNGSATSMHANDNGNFYSSYRVTPPMDCRSNFVMGDTVATSVPPAWVPVISGPIYSVLDVAPLAHVKEFLGDIKSVSQTYLQRHLQVEEYDSQCERVPLFLLPVVDPTVHSQKSTSQGLSPCVTGSLAPHRLQKKTMAAALVESTKRESIALVPVEVVKVVQRFCPFFNTALFPHKPPSASNANRVLFTEAEDELLALGLMVYNNDWRAIQERFLPCKTPHQIYVRAKNRSTSRASANSIKAVRQMKASPLTQEEKACISEGLKIFKLDWYQVWQYCVPYRDPTMLPRQWRISQGIQKSYRTGIATKERRRVYEARRRKAKALHKDGSGTVDIEEITESDNDEEQENSGGDNTEGVDASYIHEAFVADGNKAISKGVHLGERKSMQQSCSSVAAFSSSCPLSQPIGAQKSTQGTSALSHIPQAAVSMTDHLNSTSFRGFDRRHIKNPDHTIPYKARKKDTTPTVKLAPDLPPLNLPPTVRVISHSTLLKQHYSSSDGLHSIQSIISSSEAPSMGTPDSCSQVQHSKDIRDGKRKSSSSDFAMTMCMTTSPPCFTKGLSSKNKHLQKETNDKDGKPKRGDSNCKVSNKFSRSIVSPGVAHIKESNISEGNGISETDAQVHPLLLHDAEDAIHYQQNGNGRDKHCSMSPAFASQIQRVSLLKTQLSCTPFTRLPSSDSDFHPLLQRTSDTPVTEEINVPTLEKSSDLRETGLSSIPVHPSPYTTRAKKLPIKKRKQNSLSNEQTSSAVDICHLNQQQREGLGYAGFREELDEDNANDNQVSENNVPHWSFTVDGAQKSAQNLNSCIPETRNANFHGRVMVDNQAITESNCQSISLENTIKDKVKPNVIFLQEDSLPGIVMEQEELSDSEDEIEDNVEFECEEIADSDAEPSITVCQNTYPDKEQCVECRKEEIVSEGDKTVEEHKDESCNFNLASEMARQNLCKTPVAATVGKNLAKNRARPTKSHVTETGSSGIKSKGRKQNPNQGPRRKCKDNVKGDCVKNHRKKSTLDLSSSTIHSYGVDGILNYENNNPKSFQQTCPRNSRKQKDEKFHSRITSHVNSRNDRNPDTSVRQLTSQTSLSSPEMPDGENAPQIHTSGDQDHSTSIACKKERAFTNKGTMCMRGSIKNPL